MSDILSTKPTLNLVFFKHLADSTLYDYFTSSEFTKEEDGYALVDGRSETTLRNLLDEAFISHLLENVTPWSLENPNHYFIIGACLPKDNLLLDFQQGCMVSERTRKLIDAEYPLRYVFMEDDLKADPVMFNSLVESLFVRYFDHRRLLRRIGKDYSNVHFIRHRRLDCYVMFKLMKYIYGRSNCLNLFLQKRMRNNMVIRSVNEMIDSEIDKRGLTGSIQLRTIANEVRQYLDFCLGISRS